MTGPRPATGRFLGRPDEAYPGFVPEEPPAAVDDAASTHRRAVRRTRSAASRLWLVQALTGTFLIVFLGAHLVAQHLLAPGGLRDYAAVVAYLREPVALAAELGLMASVIVHACAGVRSALVDVLPKPAHLRLAAIAIAVVGAIGCVYAVWLTLAVVAAAPSV